MQDESGDSGESVRIIKKYPNRRLYDTYHSVYIKLDDVREMVLSNTRFQIVDSKTGEDVTRSVLLQIIVEQESDIDPLFSSDNLLHFIRYYGQNQNTFFSEYLEKSLELFQYQQEQFDANMKEMASANPMKMFTDLAKQNAENWQALQENFFYPKGRKK